MYCFWEAQNDFQFPASRWKDTKTPSGNIWCRCLAAHLSWFHAGRGDAKNVTRTIAEQQLVRGGGYSCVTPAADTVAHKSKKQQHPRDKTILFTSSTVVGILKCIIHLVIALLCYYCIALWDTAAIIVLQLHYWLMFAFEDINLPFVPHRLRIETIILTWKKRETHEPALPHPYLLRFLSAMFNRTFTASSHCSSTVSLQSGTDVSIKNTEIINLSLSLSPPRTARVCVDPAVTRASEAPSVISRSTTCSTWCQAPANCNMSSSRPSSELSRWSSYVWWCSALPGELC